MSEEIIKVLDDLGNRFGIAIDWSNQNVIPYLQELMQRFISMRNVQAIIQIVICFVIITALTILIIRSVKFLNRQDKNSCEYDDLECLHRLLEIVLAVFIILAFTVAICNIFGLIQNVYTPEITIIEYITNQGGI